MIIETERLTMRPLTLDDAPVLQKIMDDPKIAEQLPAVPYPLPPNGAEEWIRSTLDDIAFACVGREEHTMGILGGIVSLHLEPGNRAQLGGWCAEEWRHNGYAVEAMHACVRYGYETLGLKTIYALRKGRLWLAPRDFGERHLPFKHEPGKWHVLDEAAEDGAGRGPIAWIGQRLGRFFRRG